MSEEQARLTSFGEVVMRSFTPLDEAEKRDLERRLEARRGDGRPVIYDGKKLHLGITALEQ